MPFYLHALRTLWIVWLITLLISVTYSVATAFILPDTGITTCHDASGNVIVCPTNETELYYGQDAQFGPGTMSFALGTGDFLGTVTDQNTGLVWEQKVSADGQVDAGNFQDADNVYAWDGLQDKIDQLNQSGYLGYSDWRLPTAEELDHLVDLSVAAPGPTIDTVFFPQTRSAYYWSSDIDVENTAQVWVVDFASSVDQVVSKAERHYVRLVRGSLQ